MILISILINIYNTTINFILNHTYDINILETILWTIFFIALINFAIEGFKLSKNLFLKFIQYLTIIIIITYIIIIIVSGLDIKIYPSGLDESLTSIVIPSVLENNWWNSPNPIEGLINSIFILGLCNMICIFSIIIFFIYKSTSNYNFKFYWIDFLFPLDIKGLDIYNVWLKNKLRALLKVNVKAQNANIYMFFFILTLSNFGMFIFTTFLVDNFEQCSNLYLSFKK